MKKKVIVAVLFGVCGMFLLGSGAFAASKIEIGCAIYKFDDTFMTGVRNAIAEAAKGKAKVDIVDSQNSQSTQNDRVDMFITKRMNALPSTRGSYRCGGYRGKGQKSKHPRGIFQQRASSRGHAEMG